MKSNQRQQLLAVMLVTLIGITISLVVQGGGITIAEPLRWVLGTIWFGFFLIYGFVWKKFKEVDHE